MEDISTVYDLLCLTSQNSSANICVEEFQMLVLSCLQHIKLSENKDLDKKLEQ